MPKDYSTSPVKQALETAKNTLILLPQEPSVDAVASALALYLSFQKKQINSIVGCSTPMTVNYNRLFAVDKVKQHIGNQNLVISFDYLNQNLEKISHDTDQEGKFYLTIQPKNNAPAIDTQSVKLSFTGSNADLIFIINAQTMEDLGSFYQQEKSLLTDQQKTIINLDNHPNNSQFGTIKLLDPQASSCAEITFEIIKDLALPIDADMATNLLAGLESSTQNYTSPQVSADTFAIASELLKLNAQKGYLKADSAQRPSLSSLLSQARFPSVPASAPQPSSPQPSSSLKPTSKPDSAPSPDWLKPKVYKSSNLNN